MRTTATNMLLFLKGLAMGAADVVPGISGGTVAFITGIYIELVATIKSFDITALKLLKSDGPRAAWHHINGNFLVVLLAGILTSVFFFSADYALPFVGAWSAPVVFFQRFNHRLGYFAFASKSTGENI